MESSVRGDRTPCKLTALSDFSPPIIITVLFFFTVPSSGSNYSLALAIMHPYTDVDLSLTSHLGSTDDRYSASVDTWYLTSRRQRKNMALRGEIDRLRRLINLQVSCNTFGRY